MTDAIPAATIILLRENAPFDVLMIERHADTPFAGGAVVFPGGRIEASDASPEWRNYCDGVTDIPEAEIAPRVASIREAFEEAGILYARRDGKFLSKDEAADFDGRRKSIEDDDQKFLELIKSANLRLALDALVMFAQWVPPERHNGMRRYHTWFYAAIAPVGQVAREDGNEATSVFWDNPEGILTALEKGERKAIFPTLCNVQLLNESKTAQGVLDYAADRRIDLVQPAIIERDGTHYLTIPEGLGYPMTEIDAKKAFRG